MEKWLILSEQTLPVPKRRYRKAILKVGQFRKPDGVEFELSADALKAMADTYSQMAHDGHKVPIPLGHTDEEDKNRGYVDKMEFADDMLFMECEAIGAEAIEQFEQSDCSCFIPPKWEDAEGREYIRPIRHVALTQYPVIPGLGKFEGIAASLVPPKKEENTMDLSKIQAALGLSEALTDDNAEALILGGIGQLKEKASPSDPLQTARDAIKVMPGIMDTAKVNRETKLNALVLSQKISPAVKDKLVEMYTTEESLLLSLTADGGTSEFDKLVLILSQNEVVNTGGETTGMQVLNDPAKGNSNPVVDGAKAMAEAAKN